MWRLWLHFLWCPTWTEWLSAPLSSYASIVANKQSTGIASGSGLSVPHIMKVVSQLRRWRKQQTNHTAKLRIRFQWSKLTQRDTLVLTISSSSGHIKVLVLKILNLQNRRVLPLYNLNTRGGFLLVLYHCISFWALHRDASFGGWIGIIPSITKLFGLQPNSSLTERSQHPP